MDCKLVRMACMQRFLLSKGTGKRPPPCVRVERAQNVKGRVFWARPAWPLASRRRAPARGRRAHALDGGAVLQAADRRRDGGHHLAGNAGLHRGGRLCGGRRSRCGRGWRRGTARGRSVRQGRLHWPFSEPSHKNFPSSMMMRHSTTSRENTSTMLVETRVASKAVRPPAALVGMVVKIIPPLGNYAGYYRTNSLIIAREGQNEQIVF